MFVDAMRCACWEQLLGENSNALLTEFGGLGNPSCLSALGDFFCGTIHTVLSRMVDTRWLGLDFGFLVLSAFPFSK